MYRVVSDSNARHLIDKQSGFSMLEIVAVVLILALYVALSGSLLTSDRSGISVKADMHKVAARLRQARSHAIREQSVVSAVIDTERRLVAANDGARTIKLDPRYLLNVTTAQTDLGRNGIARVRFFPNGGASGATLEFVYGSSRHEVRVNWLTGRVSTRQTN